ncbi:MAG: thiamine phosphate synthase, partial [Pseudomonadales bacterium]|nr:thiamine phosphate synthase [Pseudomonadales bacterium]
MKNLKGIYGITNDALLPESKLDFAVEEAIKSGCRVLQYRSKIKDWEVRVRQDEALRLLSEQDHFPLISLDSVEL